VGVGRQGGRDVYTHLIVSEGVTAMMASIMPAPKPANRVSSHVDKRYWTVDALTEEAFWCTNFALRGVSRQNGKRKRDVLTSESAKMPLK